MSEIHVKVTDQLLKVVTAPTLASGGINEVKVVFNFCTKWEGFIKTAIFYRDTEKTYYAVLNENDTCILPWEVYAEDGTFYISVFGENDDIRRTSTVVRYKVGKGIVAEELMPSEPSPEVYDQIIKLYQEIKAIADNFDGEHGIGRKTPQGGVVFNDTANNKAGELAAAFGEEAKAWGKAAFATGTKKTRSGGKETVSGDVYYTEAIGSGSMASGMGAVAFSRASKSLGYRTQTGYPPSADWVKNRNGVTVKVDAQGNNVFPGDNVGQGAVAMGSDTVALENHTFAGGYKSKAIATASFAYGSENVTKGNCSVAMGSHNEANEECAVAIGAHNKAQCKWSLAANSSTETRANCSSAFGDGSVTAKQYNEDGTNRYENPGYAQMVVGRYNAYEDGEIDRALFVVGNGAKNQETQEVVRSNAFIVDRDGNANVSGKLSFGSVDDTSAQMVRGIERGNALPSQGKFNGQIFMLNEAVNEIVSESGSTWNEKTTVYIWSDAFDVGWIKIGEKVGELGTGFEL